MLPGTTPNGVSTTHNCAPRSGSDRLPFSRRGTHAPHSSAERGREHPPQADASCVGDRRYFFSPRLPIACQDQSASRLAVGPHSHVHGLRLPHRRRAGLLIDTERLRCPFFHARQGKYGLGAHCDLASSRPTRESSRHFPNVSLARYIQHSQETGLAAVPLIERHPVKLPAVPFGSGQQLERDLPLRPIANLVGDVGFPAAFPVGFPRLGQEQFAVEKCLERAMGHD